jgi:site-specific DNA recombinase
VAWDRLFRQPRDLERLIDLADAGFRVISSHGSRDLSDPDDRFILRIEVAHAARSSDDTSRRIKKRHQRYRELGRLTGGRPGFGFPRRDRTWAPGADETESDRPVVQGTALATAAASLQWRWGSPTAGTCTGTGM